MLPFCFRFHFSCVNKGRLHMWMNGRIFRSHVSIYSEPPTTECNGPFSWVSIARVSPQNSSVILKFICPFGMTEFQISNSPIEDPESRLARLGACRPVRSVSACNVMTDEPGRSGAGRGLPKVMPKSNEVSVGDCKVERVTAVDVSYRSGHWDSSEVCVFPHFRPTWKNFLRSVQSLSPSLSVC